MQLTDPRKTLIIAIVLVATLSLSVSCGDSATVEPTDNPVPPPTEAFLSPVVTEVFLSPVVPEGTLPPLILEESFGGVEGTVSEFPPKWKGQELSVFLAPFYPGEAEGGGGIYILEPSIHPSTKLQPSGAFQMGNVEPGQYVVVVGPGPENALVILDGDRPRVIDIAEGSILHLQDLRLEY